MAGCKIFALKPQFIEGCAQKQRLVLRIGVHLVEIAVREERAVSRVAMDELASGNKVC
jgi:hypothetical protein